MNSKRRFGLIKNLGVVAGALLLFASIAGAQESTGKFTLPFQAQWGTATLPAGSYTFALERTQEGTPMVLISAEAKGGLRVYAMGMNQDPYSATRKDELICVREGSFTIVRTLQLGSLGEAITFHMPKRAPIEAQNRNGKNQMLLAESPNLLEHLPVTISGK